MSAHAALQVHGVHHVAVKAADVERTAAFYRDVLGLAQIERYEDERGIRSFWFRCGTSIVMIERSDTTGFRRPTFNEDPPALHLLALTISENDRPRWRTHLTEHGHRIVGETNYTLYVEDPEGNRIGLCCLES